MPQISSFYGIIIFLNFSDHMPPHFHAWYGDHKCIVNIKDGIVRGETPARALKMIFEWMDMHKEELLEAWNKAINGEHPNKIEPLK